ncbi:phosphatase PAP2 family protein [Pedobacter sandarakinus]|uniref:phosphatase PAP2 family protein n=1 Tax=Pedobacter sandarakinus TaxID=353156 RepID=UPI0022450B07|nr:phosphatase PAP2 family protein [Pedobacter sandarakinus]MCX2574955.1 phosphatase PAP2 family protein [Pedobacter sandarakinus]
MNLKFRTIVFASVLILFFFIILSIYVAHHPIIPLDVAISLLVQKSQSSWLDYIMLAISFFGELPFSLLSVVLIAGIFYWKKFTLEAYYISTVLLSGLLILGIKNMINRPRPTAFYVRLVEVNRFQSYPSGHVLSYVLFFGFLIFLMLTLKNISKRIKNIVITISAFLIFAIAPSRIYLGAHWFTDTLGGFLLGLLCLLPLCYFYWKSKSAVRPLN